MPVDGGRHVNGMHNPNHQPEKAHHMDSEITTVTRPTDTIVINPQALAYTYDNADGQDIISILLDDKRIGALMVALTPDGARHVAAHLNAMCEDLGGLRTEWQRRRNGAAR